ncbi:MAG: tyrosine--tRNA ligase [Clostridiales bacterium]|jgi:tyrosyl-tRNA synthetase|nr:tyrosine--tRNA ligase [Clostridiales bacterium]
MAKNVFDTLKERGFIKQTVYEDDLYKLLQNGSVTFYVGFDPTADSLHIGHYIPIMAMAHMQNAGHTPIALIGGGTGMIGDPSNRTDMRLMMTRETVEANCAAFKKQMQRFFRFEGKNAAIMVNNGDWLLNLNYIEFMRDIGTYFSVNKMLTAECFKARLERGLSFFEFNYQLMQAYDFLVLYQKYGCRLQLGGNDQWNNILAGADLIRRKERADAYAMTFTLLETSDGRKMGKTSKGALWLDPAKTSPYDFYQYFRNVEDVKVAECLKLLTFVPLDEIAELTAHKDERINAAKKRLAYEVTALVHGKIAADKARDEAAAAFSGGAGGAAMPARTVACGLDALVVDFLFIGGVAKSKSEARALIEGGGIRIDDKRVETVKDRLCDYADKSGFVLSKGKKLREIITLK